MAVDFPNFGAIFMASRRTMEECLSRRLFGLPPSMESFVVGVRAGMVLFVFRFEDRTLHGVFRATSDGATDIVPLAYISSGRRFPSQVRFEKIWDCEALSEEDFRDAIRENYYERFKFRFGLSQDQVRKLLWLFDCKRKILAITRNLSSESSRIRDSETESLAIGRKLSSETCDGSGFSGDSGTTMISFEYELGLEKLETSSNDVRTGLGDFIAFDSGDIPDLETGSTGNDWKESIALKPEEKLEDHSKVDSTAGIGDFIPLESLDNPDNEVKSNGHEHDQIEPVENDGDFIPLPGSPGDSNDETESPGNDQMEFIPFEQYYVPMRLISGECTKKEGTRDSSLGNINQKSDVRDDKRGRLCVKGLYSDDQVDRSSVFSRLKFGSKDKREQNGETTKKDKLVRESKGDPKQEQLKTKKTSVFSRLSIPSKVMQNIIDTVRDPRKTTLKETESTLNDIEREKTKGNKTIQDIMETLSQKHVTWRKTDGRYKDSEQKGPKPAAKKNVFSRLSGVSDSVHRDYNVTMMGYAQGFNGVRRETIFSVQEGSGNYRKRKEDEKSAHIGEKLKRQVQADKREGVDGSASECVSEERPLKKMARPVFDQTSEVETSVQVHSEESSGCKEGSGSCEAPDKENIADGQMTFARKRRE